MSTRPKAIAALAALAVIAACSPATAGPAGMRTISAAPRSAPAATSRSRPGIPGRWHLTFDAEFDGTSLDERQWTPSWLGNDHSPTKPIDTHEDGCYSPSQAVVAGGALSLTAVSRTCLGFPYASGIVESSGHYSFTYGYMAARVWLAGSADGIDDWPAFWADAQDNSAHGEIDVFEGLSGRACYHIHVPDDGYAPGGCSSAAGAGGGWHTYGADWEPGSVTFYYDGRNVGRLTPPPALDAPMYLIVNLALAQFYTITAPVTMKVAFVRVWRH
jgi:beta-glucanase (GH16 family)